MNAFARHGITRIPPSSLNHLATEPAHWVMTRLLKIKTSFGAAAARGNAVEHAVRLGLRLPLTSPVPSGLPCTNSKACEADRKYNLSSLGVMQMATENLETVSSGIDTATAFQLWADDTLFEFQHSVTDRCDRQLSELGMPFMSKLNGTFIHPQAEC